MTKIEEILSNVTGITPNPFEQNSFWRLDIESVMKEYAEWYAKRTLEMLDLEAEYTDQNCYYDSWVLSDKPSTYKLPPHD